MASLIKAKRRRGLAVVEMALVFPMLMLLTVALLEYGWMFLKSQQVNQAARQGARAWARVDGTTGSAATAAADAFGQSSSSMPTGYSIAYSYTGNQANPAAGGATVTVTVTGTYGTIRLLPTLSTAFLPVPDHLTGRVSMIKEGP
jgi:Flp pilus assembly protein TadG